jgi:hypothetical protein
MLSVVNSKLAFNRLIVVLFFSWQFVLFKLLKTISVVGFKLCIHERDFIPGNDIASNITSAVHNSRKTVVVMSQNYRQSYWCMFEYNMARMESIYARNKENIIE